MKPPNVIRFLSYNIYTGGISNHQDRFGQIVDVIRSADADVVGICECTDFDKNGRFDSIQRELGMEGVMNRAPSGHHVAILSRRELGSLRPSAGSLTMYHGYASLSFALGWGARVSIAMAHMHPFSSLLRRSEMQILLARARREEQAIVMGDMNSVAPGDDLVAAGATHDYVSTRLRDELGRIDISVIGTAISHGFIDLGASERLPTYPTLLEDKAARYGGRLRLDYILATSAVADRCVQFGVIDDTHAQNASDHLPIFADFSVDG